MRKKAYLQNMALLILSVTIAFSAAELALRVYAGVIKKERTITYDRLLGWRLVPNSVKFYENEEEPYLIEINSKGRRDREYPYEKPGSFSRIVVLGDSFVFGSGGVEGDERFTEVMERSLEGTEVINMGVPAYSPDQEYLLLKSEVFKYQPDVVVLSLFVNDFDETLTSFNRSIGRPKGYFHLKGDALSFTPPTIHPLYAASHYSYILGMIESKSRVFSRFSATAGAYEGMSEGEKKAVFRAIITAIRELCEEKGAELVVVNFPHRQQREKNIIQEILDDLSTSDGLRVLDFMEVFEGNDRASTFYFKRDIHLNSDGHRFVGGELSRYLDRKGLAVALH